MTLADLSLSEFNDRLAAGSPTPGGGAAAALTGAMAAAAVEMVCNLSIGKDDFASVEDDLVEARDELQELRVDLERLADDDVAAFEEVMSAFRMDAGEERTAAIQGAMTHAAEVPLETATKCARVVELAAEVAEIGNQQAVTDAGSGGYLATAAMESALLNVEINLASIDDDMVTVEMADTADTLRVGATDQLERLGGHLDESI